MRQIITLSQGRLGVDSRPGQGSVFWFELSYDISSVDVAEGKEGGGGSEASAEALSTTATCQLATIMSAASAEKVPGEEQKPLPDNAQRTAGTKEISGGSAKGERAEALSEELVLHPNCSALNQPSVPVPASIGSSLDVPSPKGGNLLSADTRVPRHAVIRSTPQAGPKRPSNAAGVSSFSPLTALVVDDDKSVRTDPLQNTADDLIYQTYKNTDVSYVDSVGARSPRSGKRGGGTGDLASFESASSRSTGI